MADDMTTIVSAVVSVVTVLAAVVALALRRFRKSNCRCCSGTCVTETDSPVEPEASESLEDFIVPVPHHSHDHPHRSHHHTSSEAELHPHHVKVRTTDLL